VAKVLTGKDLWSPFTGKIVETADSVAMSNIVFMSQWSDPKEFVGGIDPTVKRTESSPPAGILQTVSKNPKNSGYRSMAVPCAMYMGKRLQLSGWIKSKYVQQYGGLVMFVTGSGGRIYAADN